MRDGDCTIGISRLEADMQERYIADPSLVFHFDGIVTQREDEIGLAKKLPLQLSTGALDTAER
jgi:hypothetical protein